MLLELLFQSSFVSFSFSLSLFLVFFFWVLLFFFFPLKVGMETYLALAKHSFSNVMNCSELPWPSATMKN